MQPLNLPFQSIAGYHLTQKLGSGGMGDVYKAYHSSLDRTAAIKILHQPDLADRFKNEAYIQSTVNHPNIARLYEFAIAGSSPCIIMEYVEGESLDAYLARRLPIGNDEAFKVLSQIISALRYLHSQHIQHRDIKPQNFRIQQDGAVKMLDFGIAKHKYTPKFTREGFIIGTTEYMAPEQFEQKSDLKSDMWSFGVMAYEMATGYMPFEAASPSAQRARLSKGNYTSPRVLVPGISSNLLIIIEKCLKTNPVHRASAEEIHLLINGPAHTAKTRSKTELLKVRPTLVMLFFCVILVSIIIASFYRSDTALQQKLDIVEKPRATAGANESRKVMINVPGISRAVLVFPDGTEVAAPYQVSGVNGQQVKFLIRAQGYKDKQVELEMKMGPRTYDFILEKQH